MTRTSPPIEPAQYARFFALALDMLCIADFDGYFQICNPSFVRTLGFDETELMAQPFVAFVHPDDRAATLAATARLAGGQSVHFTNRYRCKDGTYRWIEWRCSAAAAERLIYAAARDITESRQSEMALREQTQLLQLILDSMGDGVMVVSETRRLVMINRAAEELLGPGAREIMAEGDWPQIAYLFKTDQKTPFPYAELPLTRALRGESVDDVEIFVQRPNTAGLFITSSGRPMHDASGVLRGGVIVIHNQTDGRRTEQQLRLITEVVQRMPIGVNIWTLEDPADSATLTLKAYNPASVTATDTPLEALVGRRIEEVYPGTTAIGLTEQFAAIARSETSRDFGLVDGTDPHTGAPLRLNVKGFPLIDNSMCVLFENVTERLRVKERIQIYQETVKNLQTGILVLHLETPTDLASLRILASNRAASQFTGTELEASTGLRFVELFPQAVATGLAQTYADVARSGQSQNLGELHYKDERHADGVCAVRAFAQPGSRVCVMFEDITDKRRAEQLIREQADALLQLSTPMIPITDNVMVMPLIGSVDVQRAQQVMETLLDGVSRYQLRTVLLDITGVAVVDTHVASSLIQAAQAVRLLGAEVVLTGIRAEVAQSIVALGIDLKGLSTKSSLQSAIAAEFRRRR